jgi:hypothetical protein
VAIASVTIGYNGAAAQVTTSGSVTVGGHQFTVTFSNGQATVGGVVENTRLAAFTSTGFNSIEFHHAGGGTFKIGDFGAFVQTISPVTFTVPVTIQDGDGDQASGGTLSITANPSAVPVVLDLDGDGLEFVSRAAGVTFDYAGDGSRETTAWIGADDGLLVHDANSDRLVNDGNETVFSVNGSTDLEGLRQTYDSNGDGKLTADDAAWNEFGVWQDANSNGITDPGEFKSLGDLGITSIGLVSDGQSYAAANGDVLVHGEAGFTRADGSVGKVGDVSFAAAQNEEQKLQQQNVALNAMTTAALAVGLTATATPLAAAAPTATTDALVQQDAGVPVAATVDAPIVEQDASESAQLLGDGGSDTPADQPVSTGTSEDADHTVSSVTAPADLQPASPLALLDDSSLPLPEANAVSPAVDMTAALVAASPGAAAAVTDAQVAAVLVDALFGGQSNAPNIDQLLSALPGEAAPAPDLQPLAEILTSAGTEQPQVPQEILHMLAEMATTGHDAAVAAAHA